MPAPKNPDKTVTGSFLIGESMIFIVKLFLIGILKELNVRLSVRIEIQIKRLIILNMFIFQKLKSLKDLIFEKNELCFCIE